MDGKARGRVELLVTDVTFEVLGFLVVDQYLVVIKLSVAIPDHAKRKTLQVSNSIWCPPTCGLEFRDQTEPTYTIDLAHTTPSNFKE